MTFQKFRKECEKISGKYAFLLEETPKEIKADIAMPCFSLAKGKNPVEIAKKIVEKFSRKKLSLIKEIKAEGPYINFYTNWQKLGKDIIKSSMKKNYGKGKKGTGGAAKKKGGGKRR